MASFFGGLLDALVFFFFFFFGGAFSAGRRGLGAAPAALPPRRTRTRSAPYSKEAGRYGMSYDDTLHAETA